MKISRLLHMLAFSALVIPGITQALDLTFRPRLETGMEYYKLKVETLFRKEGEDFLSASQVEMSDWMPIVSGGITVLANRFYADFSGLKAFNGEDDFDRNFSIPPITGKAKGDSDFDRWEYSVSLGYLVTDNLSFFAGYRKSKIDSDFNTKPSINGVSLETTKIKADFEQDGPFLGASYGWHINKSVFKGVLSGNIAFATLDGDLDFRGAPDVLPDNDSSGDTTGMKVGFTWIGATPVEQLTYTIGVDGYKYEFDADGDDPDVTETVVNLKVGLAYTF